MTASVTRVGDLGTGICTGHPSPTPFTVTFTGSASPPGSSGSSSGQAIMRVGDKGTTTCGHTTTATTGSSIVTINTLGIHRVGDTGVSDAGGTYTVTTGDGNTIVA